MKKFVCKFCLFLVALLPTALSLGAQPHGEWSGNEPEFWEKAQEEKTEFIIGRLGLSKKESKAFLKVFDENEAKKGSLFSAREQAFRALRRALQSDANGDEISSLLQKYLDARQALDDWDRTEPERFAKVLSREQYARFVVADDQYRREQIRRLRGHGGPKGPNGSGPKGFKSSNGSGPNGSGPKGPDGGGQPRHYGRPDGTNRRNPETVSK